MAAVGLQDAPGSRPGPWTELLGMLMLGAPGAEARAKKTRLHHSHYMHFKCTNYLILNLLIVIYYISYLCYFLTTIYMYIYDMI